MARRNKGAFQKRHKKAVSGNPHYLLPGVGDGLVDPDFDSVEDAEAAAIESVGARNSDQSEDNY